MAMLGIFVKFLEDNEQGFLLSGYIVNLCCTSLFYDFQDNEQDLFTGWRGSQSILFISTFKKRSLSP